MSYVPGYDYDFFVSYASVDNDPVPSADRGWVDTLINILSSGSGLAGKLGRREHLTCWLDKQQLRGNHEADHHIPEQVKRSALFVAVLSPGYAASRFCEQARRARPVRVFAKNSHSSATIRAPQPKIQNSW